MGLIHLFDPFLQLRSLLMGIHVIPTGRSCRSAFCSYPDVQYHAIVDSDNLLHRGVPLAIRSVAARPVAEEIIKVDHGTDGFHGRKMKGVARITTNPHEYRTRARQRDTIWQWAFPSLWYRLQTSAPNAFCIRIATICHSCEGSQSRHRPS